MISDQHINNLKFSHNDYNHNQNTGILNQNPLIITKCEAFNFSYTDPNKLKLAQLLAKRDVQSLKNVESLKETTVKIAEAPKQRKNPIKKAEERVSSIKRVPGPQTPSRLANRHSRPPSILKQREMPPRSMSPPVRDTDTSWRPRPTEGNLDRLQLQMNRCTSKLDQLEKNLRRPTENLKNGRDLKVLEEKLRALVTVGSRPPYNPPLRTTDQSNHLSPSIDLILDRLNSLAGEMDNIQSRWTSLNYETVCHSQLEDEERYRDAVDYRFTRQRDEEWEDIRVEAESKDGRLSLDIPKEIVSRLDSDRQRFDRERRLRIVTDGSLDPARIGDWFSEDIVNEVVEDVIEEFDGISGELVESILNEELSD